MDGLSEKQDTAKIALTVDVVALARTRQATSATSVLLIQRRHPPFAGSWALPGGFVEDGERLREAARRELTEETGLEVGELELLGVYDTPGRDPRGCTVSIVYLARLDAEEPAVEGADDAADARWYPIDALPELAFDHDTMLADTRSRLREVDG